MQHRTTPLTNTAIEFALKTAGSAAYPREVQTTAWIEIVLPARYPFHEPSATFKTAIHHPNVYTSGRVCLGVKWLPSEGLELLVRRLAQIIVFDPIILNEKSPANPAALTWYQSATRQHPTALPTESFISTSAPSQRKTMSWSDVAPAKQVTQALVRCPQCATQLSLPTGKSGTVRCPSCGKAFRAET